MTKAPVPFAERYLDPKVVDAYDRRYHGLVRKIKGRLWQGLVRRALSRIPERGVCIDTPCGSGYLTEVILKQFELTIASDISPAMVKKACSRVPVEGVAADAMHLPFADESVDCVVNIRFMVHFGHEQRTEFLRSLARISRRYLLVNYNHRYTLKYMVRRLQTSLGLQRWKGKGNKKSTRQELRAEAQAAGLRIVKIFRPWLGLPLISERWLVLLEKLQRQNG